MREMTEQKKFGTSYEELIQYFEDSLSKRIAEIKRRVDEYKQNQCDEVAAAFEALLGGMLADLELVKQAKANLR
jgi:predicted nuclease of restriction endonuclease-like RecB superfamily